MKKIICLLLAAVVLLLFIGCQKDADVPPETEKTYQNKGLSEASSTQTKSYRNFERIVTDSTDIIKATYKGMNLSKGYYLVDFYVYDTIRGDIKNGILTIHYLPTNTTVLNADSPISYSTNKILYKPEKDYLLFLNRSNTVYTEGYFFEPAEASLIIPLAESGEPIIKDSKLYSQPLNEHLDNSVFDGIEENAFLDKVKITQNDYSQEGYRTIVTPKRDDVLKNAQFLFTVQIEEMEETPQVYYRSLCKCKVIETHKGEASEHIQAFLPTEKVEIGKKYVIAVEKGQTNLLTEDYYVPTSKNSVFDIS